MAQITIDVDPILHSIFIDPINKRLLLNGVVKYGDVTLEQFSEDVTDQLTQAQKDTIVEFVTRAETWLANHTP